MLIIAQVCLELVTTKMILKVVVCLEIGHLSDTETTLGHMLSAWYSVNQEHFSKKPHTIEGERPLEWVTMTICCEVEVRMASLQTNFPDTLSDSLCRNSVVVASALWVAALRPSCR